MPDVRAANKYRPEVSFECLLTFMLALLLSGCGGNDAESDISAEAAFQRVERSWDEQLEAVQRGQSDTIVIESHSVSSAELSELASVSQLLTRLEISHGAIAAEDYTAISQLQRLQRLKLEAEVDDAALQQIALLKSLQVLNLPNGQFTTAGISALSCLDDLLLLRIASPHVDDQALQIIAEFPALRFLHLIDCPITDNGLAELHGWRQLESLYIDGGNVTDQGLRDLLEALPELHLHLDQLHLPGDPNADVHE